MNPILSWYKLLPLQMPAAGAYRPEVGRVQLLGGATVKNGSTVELRGVHYAESPQVTKFKLRRKHVFRDEWATTDVAARFEERYGYGYVAWSDATRLQSGSRALNRKFRFEDYYNSPPSGEIKTTRFGQFEVTALEIEVSGTVPAPMVIAKMHALVKPVKDPDVNVSVLLPETRFGEGERGYRDLNDLVRADLTDDTPDEWRAEAERFTGLQERYVYGDFRVTVTPSSFHIADNSVGFCVVELEMFGPGRLPFAIQAVATDPRELTVEDEGEFPIDDDLRGVIVSDVRTLELTQAGQVTLI